MDNIVDRLDEAIKLYVTKVTSEGFDDRDGRRAMEIIAFAINLEHIGDIIDKNLMELANKKIKHKYEFSKEGATELAMFHQRIIENLKLAFSVFINEDMRIARTLIEEKTQLRVAELGYAESHLARLRDRRPESIETSSLHIDVVRGCARVVDACLGMLSLHLIRTSPMGAIDDRQRGIGLCSRGLDPLMAGVSPDVVLDQLGADDRHNNKILRFSKNWKRRRQGR